MNKMKQWPMLKLQIQIKISKKFFQVTNSLMKA